MDSTEKLDAQKLGSDMLPCALTAERVSRSEMFSYSYLSRFVPPAPSLSKFMLLPVLDTL